MKFNLAQRESLFGTDQYPGPGICRAGGYDIDPEGQIMRMAITAE